MMMKDQLVYRFETIQTTTPLTAYAAMIDVEQVDLPDSPNAYFFSLKSDVQPVSVIQLRQFLPIETVYQIEKRTVQRSSINEFAVEYDTDLMEQHLEDIMTWLGNPCVFGCFIGEQGIAWGYVLSANAEVDAYRYMKTINEYCETEPFLLDLRPATDRSIAKQRFEEFLKQVNEVAR